MLEKALAVLGYFQSSVMEEEMVVVDMWLAGVADGSGFLAGQRVWGLNK